MDVRRCNGGTINVGSCYVTAYSLGAPNSCDSSIHTASKEGNVGETGTFPWLGVLRVHLSEQFFSVLVSEE